MKSGIGEFLSSFEPGDHEELETPPNSRDVYIVPGEKIGLENDYVLKEAISPGKGTAPQNLREVEVFLESRKRGQDFAPPVLGGASGFGRILVRRLQPLATEKENVLPEEWNDKDISTEYGIDQGKIKVVDSGLMYPEDGWTFENLLETSQVECYSIRGDGYFQVETM